VKEINISPRLLTAADFVRQDAILADVGTDHAYLPLFLLKSGRIRRAVLSDVNRGPLDSARANAEAAGLSDRVELVLTDGAAALSGRGITDYAICGMGGELIADIIERAPEMKSPLIRLILQPMTRRDKLSLYLAASGFEVLAEEYSRDGGKYYVTLYARYDGVRRDIDEFEAEFGKSATPCQNKEARLGYLRARLASYKKRRRGVLQSKNQMQCYSQHIAYMERLIEEVDV